MNFLMKEKSVNIPRNGVKLGRLRAMAFCFIHWDDPGLKGWKIPWLCVLDRATTWFPRATALSGGWDLFTAVCTR